jgi:small subunit ribosomal protein S18
MAFKKKPMSKSRPQSGNAGEQGRPGGRFRKGGHMRRKVCRFCADKLEIDYKNISMLRAFVTEKGKILSGRVTGVCAKHQRELGASVKRARMLALLPFTVN